jgi:hypothetical protein
MGFQAEQLYHLGCKTMQSIRSSPMFEGTHFVYLLDRKVRQESNQEHVVGMIACLAGRSPETSNIFTLRSIISLR